MHIMAFKINFGLSWKPSIFNFSMLHEDFFKIIQTTQGGWLSADAQINHGQLSTTKPSAALERYLNHGRTMSRPELSQFIFGASNLKPSIDWSVNAYFETRCSVCWPTLSWKKMFQKLGIKIILILIYLMISYFSGIFAKCIIQ